jgi:murein DD-endopeptidase MepM/ murein hydrolase activator NlpD
MERYSLIVVSDVTAPIRRFEILKKVVHRALAALGVGAVLLTLGMVDYVSLRREHSELARLRGEAEAQRARITAFEAEMGEVGKRLELVRELERKVRIIANLPGAAGAGGEEIGELGAGQGGAAEADEAGADPLALGADGTAPEPGAASGSEPAAAEPHPDEEVSVLRQEALRLGIVADAQALSLEELLDGLTEKQHELASSPTIWPARGWLTSRFGFRISPFTGHRQFHSGIDVAGRSGTDIVAPARGRVVEIGSDGPLGRSVTLDHGYGIRTLYGHLQQLHVKKGQEVERGQVIAALGNSGRSTGPHLHYGVSVRGKPANPIDYIFD